MPTEPPIDETLLQATLRDAYGLRGMSLAHVPRGEESWCYRVEGAHSTYLLKVYTACPPPREVFAFVRALRERGRVDAAIYPQWTRQGEPLAAIGHQEAALFPYVDGFTLADRLPQDALLFRLGETMAAVHECASLRDECPVVDRFDAPCRDNLARVLEAANNTKMGHVQPLQAQARDLLRRGTDEILDLRATLLMDQRTVRERDLELVVCHGEPSPGNVLFSTNGRPFLVDWNTLVLAPRERDLMFFLEPEYRAVMAGYRRVVPELAVNEDVVRFYQRHWTLGEIVHFGRRLLLSSAGAAQGEKDLDGLREVMGWIGVS